MGYTVFDIECNGLRGVANKIHCLVYQQFDSSLIESRRGVITDYEEMKTFLLKQKVLVGHNIIRYDIPVLQDILKIRITAKLIDTLGLSWYLFPEKLKHGLEEWGVHYGVPKPVVTDWNNLTQEEYIHRCSEDVKINSKLFLDEMQYLDLIYDKSKEEKNRLIYYLSFKLDCAREQEEVGVKIDIRQVKKSLQELGDLRDSKLNQLSESMPRNIKFKEIKKPKTHKKNGELSKAGIEWFNLLVKHNLPETWEDPVTVEASNEQGSATSNQQLKSWLYGLGWEPITFEYRKNTKGEVNEVPQIYDGDGVCQSIKDLYIKEPALEQLDMLGLIKHRYSVFEGFEKGVDESGFTKAEVAGFTNTLRFRHSKPIVNLPKVSVFYGEEIRSSIISPGANHVLCGSDMSALEDTTKQHYMYFFDPDYVTQMRVPGFDPHLDIAVLAGMLTIEQAESHKAKKQDFSSIRSKAKTVNFAGVYGAGPPKIALTSGMSLKEAQKLHSIYWSRNKSVKQIAASCITKTVKFGDIEQKWLFNPVSNMWYSLRFEKDRFSTLNQGTGVYCFDLWVKEVRKKGIRITLQYHDEIAFVLEKGKEEETRKILLDCIQDVNNRVKLNVPLGVSVDFGNKYSEIH